MLEHITAALAAFFLLLPGSVFAESLDLSSSATLKKPNSGKSARGISAKTAATGACQNDGSVIVDFRDEAM